VFAHSLMTEDARERESGSSQAVGGVVKLRSGCSMPSVGLGLWKCKPDEASSVVRSALEAGVCLLDGAAGYDNEVGVGIALKEAVSEGNVKREEVFVVSKLFSTHHVWKGDVSRVEESFHKTLSDLQLDYLDLYLMHWPFAFEQTDVRALGGLRLSDGTPNPKLNIEMEFLETYAEMLKLKQTGKVRAIGVCNFTQAQLEALLEKFPSDPPCVNQVELHPYLVQSELTGFCKSNGIHLMAYSPLGSGDSYSGKSYPARGDGPFQNLDAGTTLLNNDIVGGIASKLNRTPAQVLIRWSLQMGFICIPKSSRAERIKENAAVLDWCISDEDVARLNALDCGFRYGIGYMKGHYDCPNAPWFEP